MRRNILTCILWFSALALFLLHLILTQKQNGGDFESIAAQKKQQIAKTTRKTENDDSDVTKSVQQPEMKNHMLKNQQDHLHVQKLLKTVEQLKKDVSSSKRREKHLKHLARRLAAKLKGKEGGNLPKLDSKIPWIFGITPTYARFTQKADLVRLSQTLMHVTNLHWIIVEDSTYRTDLISRFLHATGLSFTHLNFRTPVEMQRKKYEHRRKHHRGVGQRNLALTWIRENIDPVRTPGVVYFMDDDNTYHVNIFDEMRWTKGVSVWPVGLTGGARWAGPIVKNGKVVSFHTNWAPTRSFPLDMAAFSINLNVLLKDKPHAQFNSSVQKGFLEPSFLEQLTTKEQLEPLADNCTKVFVWHTRTEVAKASIQGERELIKAGRPSDIRIET